MRRIWQVFSQENNQEGHRDVTHTLDISAGWVSIVPDKQQSFEHLLHVLALADKLKVRTYSFDIGIDDMIYLLFVLAKIIGSPVVFEQLAIFGSLLQQYLLGIVNENILE